MNVAPVGNLEQDSARLELGRKVLSVPQSSGGNVSVQDLILDDSLNARLEKIFGRPFPAVIKSTKSEHLRLTARDENWCRYY